MKNDTKFKFFSNKGESFSKGTITYAPLYKRFASFGLDVFSIYLALYICVRFGVGMSFTFFIGSFTTGKVIVGFTFLSYFFSSAYLGKNQTGGNSLFKITLTSVDGTKKINSWNAFVRSGLLTIIAYPIFNGIYLIAAVTLLLGSVSTLNSEKTKEKKQTLWDLASNCCVIETTTFSLDKT